MDKEIEKKDQVENLPKGIDRKEALKRTGYLALSAATMMILLNKPDKAVASSPTAPPGW